MRTGAIARRVAWTSPLLLLLALTVPAGAQAAWSTPVTLSASGQAALYPQVAVDPSGNATFVWTRYDGTTGCGSTSGCLRVQTSTRSAAGVVSAVQDLSPAGQYANYPKVGVDQNGNAVFVWQRYDGTTSCGGYPGCWRIQTRARSAAGALSSVQTLSAAGQLSFYPQVAVDPNGNSVFAWEDYDNTTDCGGSCTRIQGRARSAAGALSAIQILSDPGQHADDPHVGVDQSGNAVFVWLRGDGTTNCAGSVCYRIQARARSSAGVLSAAQNLSDTGQWAINPQLAVDPGGDAVVVWQRRDGTTQCASSQGCYRVQTRARSAAGALSAVQTLTGAGKNATRPRVGIDQNGNAVFAWERRDETTDCGTPCTRIQTRARTAAGTLSAVQVLSDPGQHARYPRVAVDRSGNAVFIWERYDGTNTCYGGNACLRAQVRVRSAAGALSAVETFSPPGTGVFPQIGINQGGTAAAVWTNGRIHAAIGP